MGERSWDESIAEVSAQLDALREAVGHLPPGAKPSHAEVREILSLARRIGIMAYAHERGAT